MFVLKCQKRAVHVVRAGAVHAVHAVCAVRAVCTVRAPAKLDIGIKAKKVDLNLAPNFLLYYTLWAAFPLRRR